MTDDRERLLAIFLAFDVDTLETAKCITAAGRRFFFNVDGEIEKIIFRDLNGEKAIARPERTVEPQAGGRA